MNARKWSKRSKIALVLFVMIGGAALAAWRYRDRIAVALFGPPEVTLKETYEENPQGPTFDHTPFDALLSHHVDADGWVDYAGLKSDERMLEDYLESLGSASFDLLGRNEKLALLINAYNAFTLKLILDHYPLVSIQDIPAADRWKDVRWKLGENTWSLNQIEHEQIRPRFREPRIHFALVCAAVGCPPLRAEAYHGSRIESQLQNQALYVHRHKTWLHVDEDRGVVGLSRLYLWYAGDFEQVDGSVQKFTARFHPGLQRLLDDGQELRVEWLHYDWRLNDTQNKSER